MIFEIVQRSENNFESWLCRRSFRAQWMVFAVTVSVVSIPALGTLTLGLSHTFDIDVPLWMCYGYGVLVTGLGIHAEGEGLIPEGGFSCPGERRGDTV